ncbi:MAG: phosphatidylinositol mannoside acyltransferase [Actinomycetota bacterium]|nr:phosphatidylinositol mannoside acyltransferase [Actinomycetota bacterium]
MKDLLAYWGLRAGVGLVGLLPEKTVRGLGGAGGRVWHSFDRDRRQMAFRHMERVLGNGADVEEASTHVMESYGRYFAEALWARADRVPELLRKTEVEGLEMVEAARDEGGGMIYALPHLGNWEVAAPVAVNIGVPVVAVAEDLPNKRITEWFTSMRGEFGIEIVLATGRIEVMRKLEKAISDNKAVALLSDRDIKGRGVEVEFFGEKTTIPPGPATLAVKTGAPLFPVGTYFDGHGHRVVVKPSIPIPEAETRSEQVRLMSQALAIEMESLIMRAPDQWHLVQPNWPSDLE